MAVISRARLVSRRALGFRSVLAVAVAFPLLVGGCHVLSSDDPPVSDSTLVAVLAEMHLASERVEVHGTFSPGGRDSILARHGLTQTEFDAAMDYYSRDVAAYDSLYDVVVDSLSSYRSRLEMGPVIGGRDDSTEAPSGRPPSTARHDS